MDIKELLKDSGWSNQEINKRVNSINSKETINSYDLKNKDQITNSMIKYHKS